MKMQQAVREIRKLQDESNEASVLAENASRRYEAHMTLYNVAASTCDHDEQDKQREILHNLVDQLLDATHVIGGNGRRIREIVSSAEE